MLCGEKLRWRIRAFERKLIAKPVPGEIDREDLPMFRQNIYVADENVGGKSDRVDKKQRLSGAFVEDAAPYTSVHKSCPHHMPRFHDYLQ